MNTNRLLVGTIVGAIALYLTGMIIWEYLFSDFFAANSGSAVGVDRDNPILWAVIFGNVLYALLLTIVLELRGASGSLAGAVIIGAIVGALMWGTADFIWYGFNNVNNLLATVADTLLEGVHAGISTGIVAAVLSRIGTTNTNNA